MLFGIGPKLPEAGRLPEPGTVLERQLAGGEAHRYLIDRGPQEELWFTVAQSGIDVTVSVLGSAAESLWTIDSPGGLWGEEWLHLGEELPGASAIEIRPLAAHSAPGTYRLSFVAHDSTAPRDPRRRAAERATTEAGRLYFTATRDSRHQALEAYRQALAGWQDLGKDRETTRILLLLGKLHRHLDEPHEALAVLRQALNGWKRLGDRLGQAQALIGIASTARLVGGTEYVEETYQQALELWRELGDLQGQAWTLNYLGLTRARQAPHSALGLYGQALALFRQVGDRFQEGVVLNNLGGAHDLLGEPHEALEHYAQALEVYQRLDDLRLEAAILNNLASIHLRIGQLEEALDSYTLSLEARRQLDDRRGQARVLNNMGRTWLALGDPARAKDLLHQALRWRRESLDRRGEAITLQNLGAVLAELGDWQAALDSWTQALTLQRTFGDPSEEAITLVNLGRAASRLRRAGPARQYVRDALTLLAEIGNPWRTARAGLALGQILTAAGEPENAIPELESSLRLFRETSDDVSEGETLLALARAERTLATPAAPGHLAAAWSHSLAALDRLESVRADVDSLGLRSSFLAHHSEAFELAIELAMENHRQDPAAGWDARALETSERARARNLLDLLKEARAGLRRGVSPELLARQQRLLEQLSVRVARRRRALERDGPSAASERRTRAAREVRAQLEAVENEIRRQSPAWDALVPPRPLQAGAIQALLDPGTMLLEVSLGETQSFLWAVTRETIESFELPGRDVVEAAAREVYEELRVHDPRGWRSRGARSAELSEILLGPLRQRLTDQRLVVVADGALHYLPFAALPHPGAPTEPLIARHEVVALPSASALSVQRQTLAGRPAAAKTLAILADPVFEASDPRLRTARASAPQSASAPQTDSGSVTFAATDPAYRDAPSGGLRLERLAWSRWEAETLSAHAGSEQTDLALGFDAGLAAVHGGRLKGYRIVHFATHGIVESEHPELSALVLSLYDRGGQAREGLLRLPEIYNLDLDAELVVLSGCRTALGPEIRGEGLVGLTRGFFAAGARSLVASHWRVQDRAAAELMDRFYRHLLEGEHPLRPAAALRAAQLELLNDSEYRDPYFWAAFAVYGDWR